MAGDSVVVSASPEAFAPTASRWIRQALAAKLGGSRPIRVVLAGGSTPAPVYRSWVSDAVADYPWERFTCFFSDERCVAADDPLSNFRMAREAFGDVFERLNVMRMRGELGPQEGASDYRNRLRGHFGGGDPRFDLVLLGLGQDGHTASLFSLPQGRRPETVVATRSPAAPHPRISLGAAALSATDQLAFLVCGAAKAAIVARVLAGSKRYPAVGVRAAAGETVWILDPEAASGLEPA